MHLQQSLRRNVFSLALAVALVVLAPRAWCDSTAFAGSATGKPGDEVEITIDLASTLIRPATLILVVAYDPNALEPALGYYEYIQTNINGQPLIDDQGNVEVERSFVRRENATAEGKLIETVVHPEGAVAIVLTGGTATLPDELLFTLAFRISDQLQDGSTLGIDVVTADAPVRVFSESSNQFEDLFSSAAGVSGQPLNLAGQDGLIDVGCQPPDTPGNVTASQDRSADVTVSWGSVAGSNIQYRVFRAAENNPVFALPLGEGWQTGTSFRDRSAKPPLIATASGCNMPPPYTAYDFYYWVQSRDDSGCPSDLSTTPAVGYRVPAKLLDGPAEATMPGTDALLALVVIVLLCSLARRWKGVR